MYYKRKIEEKIKKELFKGKIIILYGPRRVGKTTLVKEILKDHGEAGFYVNCEAAPNLTALTSADPRLIKDFFKGAKLAILDEAQKVPQIGAALKLMIDTFPETQIIATGSSSFDLVQKISEPLTGRARRFFLYPLDLQEIAASENRFAADSRLEKFLRFGTYPSVVDLDEKAAAVELAEIAENYLYRDALSFESLRKPDLVKNLLQALALQTGGEVSINELANLLKHNARTVERYLQLLEESFVIFRLRALSRNPRNEIARSQKFYFYDLGIRNHLIQNFNQISLRQDAGALWENFCVAERMRHNVNNDIGANYYFWRTYDQKEIDLIEERGGRFLALEFKLREQKTTAKKFLKSYPNSKFSQITRQNYWDNLLV
jgi:predicted AAA+ superfamily ATPase